MCGAWHMKVWQYDEELRHSMQASLDAFKLVKADSVHLREAAVAIVVVGLSSGEAGVLLTLRTSKLGKHAGQFALPGGKVDEGESAENGARRELHEELGLALPLSAYLGRLDDYCTRSGFCISPFVYWGGAQPELTLSENEVAELYRVPLSELDSEAIPYFEEGVEINRPVLLSKLPSIGTDMYSPTAALLYQFREVVLRGRQTRVAHYDQPSFAWR